MKVKVSVGAWLLLIYWSESWFRYADSRGFSRWFHWYRHEWYRGWTLRIGKITFTVMEKDWAKSPTK